MSILELSKVLIFEFRWNCVKPKYREKIKLCFMDTCSFTVYIKIDYIYKDINLETRFGTSNYELKMSLPKAKNNKSYWLDKGRIRWKMMTEFIGLRARNL